MSAQMFGTQDGGAVRASRATRSRPAGGGLGKYQLEVTACDVADVVRSAGGWLFDRAMAGWDVTVALTRGGDVRPLQILGVTVYPQDVDDDDASALPRGRAVAISSDVVATDPLVRSDVVKALKRGLTEVTLWGGPWPAALGSGSAPVEHVLSAAARAFKAHALAALGSSEPVGPVETFRSKATAVFADYSDLTPSAASSLAQR
jgi:hypothetical protein